MRRLILLFLLCAPAAFSYASYSGWCEQGGIKVGVAGQNSPLYFQQSYPNFTSSGSGPHVTVYATGTINKVSIYSDNSGTVLANPFPCSSTGQYQFFTNSSIVDLLFFGTGISSFTRGSIDLPEPIGIVSDLDATVSIGTLCARAAAQSEYLLLTQAWTSVAAGTYECTIMQAGGSIQPINGATVSFTLLNPTTTEICDISLGGVCTITSKTGIVYPEMWGAVADGTGTGGTDQSEKIQAAVTGSPNSIVAFSPATLAYVVSNAIYIPSNKAAQIEKGATVQKMFGTQGDCATYACTSMFVLGSTTGTSACSNTWLTVNGVIDGNRANITGVSGDGFNEGVYFGGCTNSGVNGTGSITNAYTDNVYIDCWYDSPPFTGPHNGDNVLVTGVSLSNAGRVNYVTGCGTNNQLTNSILTGGGDRVSVASIDFEIFEAGQLMSGGLISTVTVSGYAGQCITWKPVYDTGATLTINNLNCAASNTGTVGIEATNFGTFGGSLTVTGGSVLSGTVAGIAINNIAFSYISTTVNVPGVVARGLFSDANPATIILGPGSISGGLYDLDINCAISDKSAKRVGVTLAHNTINGGETCILPLDGITNDPAGNVLMPVKLSAAKVNVITPAAEPNYIIGYNPEVLGGFQLLPVPGYRITIPLTSNLRDTGSGINTLQIGSTAYEIRSSQNPANRIANARLAGGAVDLFFTGYASSSPTTLAAAITTSGQTAITVTSGAGIANGNIIQIGCEWMTVVSGGGTGSLVVTRAAPGGCPTTTYINGSTVSLITLVWEDMGQ